jgi:ABC-type uncharacterized transport system substrate-binding protein
LPNSFVGALTDALIPDLIASCARPGCNVTGVAHSVESLTGKLVEVAMDIIPATVRIGFLSNPTGASMAFFAQRVEAAARARAIATLIRGLIRSISRRTRKRKLLVSIKSPIQLLQSSHSTPLWFRSLMRYPTPTVVT